jgi:hypothetical protein
MRIFYDCEFLEDGKTIDLISIGMIAEAGDEYYAVNSDLPIERIESHGWLMKNVVPHIPGQLQERSFDDNRNLNGRFTLDPTDAIVKPHWVIANKVRDFILGQPDPQWWAWYGAPTAVVEVVPPPRLSARAREDELVGGTAADVGDQDLGQVRGQLHRAPRASRFRGSELRAPALPIGLPCPSYPQHGMRLGENVHVPHLERGQLSEAQAGPDPHVAHVPHRLALVRADQLVLLISQKHQRRGRYQATQARRQPRLDHLVGRPPVVPHRLPEAPARIDALVV